MLLLLPMVSGAAFAQVNQDILRIQITERKEALRGLADRLNAPNADLVAVGDGARDLREQILAARPPVKEERDILFSDLERLGPAPADDGVPEPEETAQTRSQLTERLGQVDGLLREIDLNLAEVERLIKEVAERRREAFYGAILERRASPLIPSVWSEAIPALGAMAARTRDGVSAWRTDNEARGTLTRALIGLGLACGFALLMFLPVRRLFNRLLTARIEAQEPLPSRRILAAAARTVARAAPGLIGGLVVYETAKAVGLIPPSVEAVGRVLWLGFVALLVVDGATIGLFAPRSPEWRALPVRSSAALTVRPLLFLATVALVFDVALATGAGVLGASVEVIGLTRALVAVTLALILIALSQGGLWRVDEDRAGSISQDTINRMRTVRRVGIALGLSAIIAVLMGYVSLGHYAMTRVFCLAALGAVALFLRALAHEGVRLIDRRFTTEADDTADSERLVFFWIRFAIDVFILWAIAPPAMLILGADWADVRNLLHDAFFGFKIGDVTVSLAQILFALVVFLLLLATTRFIQRAAESQVFPQLRMDVGVRNSLKTLIGYVGLVIAAAVGVGMLGFNLSNLAIIAGALSVGIGFGLQSIVNNFVSGLIILFERPIKVGDWIVTASGEGIVKRISVRSTEIETFDRSSVIVPNAELVTGAVTNWTHKDRLGRVTIHIGVSYSEDPELVLRLLAEIAEEHPNVLPYPKALILFVGFGASSLDFEMRCYVSDITSSLSTRTELRIAIFKKFKEYGVEIPFPQQDVYVKALPGAQGDGALGAEPA
ncbi:MAG: DUF3772 domain-containing protein, partial [Pseudomonadota bacterium]